MISFFSHEYCYYIGRIVWHRVYSVRCNCRSRIYYNRLRKRLKIFLEAVVTYFQLSTFGEKGGEGSGKYKKFIQGCKDFFWGVFYFYPVTSFFCSLTFWHYNITFKLFIWFCLINDFFFCFGRVQGSYISHSRKHGINEYYLLNKYLFTLQ